MSEVTPEQRATWRVEAEASSYDSCACGCWPKDRRILALLDALEHAEAVLARVEALAQALGSDDCELYDEPGWDCITAGPAVLAADGCLPCRLRAALAADTEERS